MDILSMLNLLYIEGLLWLWSPECVTLYCTVGYWFSCIKLTQPHQSRMSFNQQCDYLTLWWGAPACPCSETSGGQESSPICPSEWMSRLWLLSGRLRGIIPLLICPHSLAVDLQEFSWSSTWQKSIFALKVNLRRHLLSLYIDWFQLCLIIYILHCWGLERFLNL